MAGGRRLAAPAGRRTRPTSDRTREGLFSALEARRGGLVGARVADLYAGSGAVGLDALSRGAAHALFVESEPAALRALRDNVRTLGLAGALILPASVERVVEGPPPGPPYHIVFADPPYALTDTALLAVLAAVTAHGWLTEGGLLVVERPSRGTPPRWPPGVEPVRSRRYGEGTLWYGRAGPADLDGS